jgi:hypothetical protein
MTTPQTPKTSTPAKRVAFVIQGTPAVLKKLINGKTLLFAVTIGVNAALSAIAAPSPQELNLTPRPIISARVERTIASIACEGASNGLPKADLRMDVYANVLRNSSRYSPKEFKVITDQIVDQSAQCSPCNNNQLTAKN